MANDYDYDYVDPNFDNPKLNKCTNCGALFDGTTCPICKTECPDRRLAPDYAEYVQKCERQKKRGRFSIRAHHSTYAITGLICGILSLFLPLRSTWIAVVLSIVAVDMFVMDKRLGKPSGLAIAGLVCGILGFLLTAGLYLRSYLSLFLG